MTALQHHPAFWLRDDAAQAFNAAENAHGVLTVNSAGRTVSEQQALINRWNAGGAANRPPYLYKPAMPASASNHVANGGVAVDIKEYAKFAGYCLDYGFVHAFPTSDPVHFEFHGVNPTTGHTNANETIRQQQAWLISQGYDLGPSGADGIAGPKYKAAVEAYQTALRPWGYTGKIDGIWGAGTQAAHAAYYAHVTAAPSTPPPATPPASGGHTATVADLLTLSDIRGFQKIARLNGGATAVDNKPGPKTTKGMQTFLNVNYKGSVANWLRAKWGYKDADNIWGPNMRAAAERANAANFAQLK